LSCQSGSNPQERHGITTVPSEELDIVNKLGLHARAAGRFSALASEYPCTIRVTRGERTVDGKSVMGLMMLAAGCGSRIQVEADGEQAEEALTALRDLVADGFGEGTGPQRSHDTPSDH